MIRRGASSDSFAKAPADKNPDNVVQSEVPDSRRHGFA
jgi:hypothetical protein